MFRIYSFNSVYKRALKEKVFVTMYRRAMISKEPFPDPSMFAHGVLLDLQQASLAGT